MATQKLLQKFVGQKIKELRKGKKYTQDDLALKLKVSRGAVAQYEEGRNFPSVDSLVFMANLFEVSLDYIVGLSTNKNNTTETDDFYINKIKLLEEEVTVLFRIANKVKGSELGSLKKIKKDQDK